MAQRRRGKRSRTNEKNNADETIVDLIEARESAQSWFDKNRQTILTAVGVVVLLIVGFVAYKLLYQQPREKQALSQMYKAEQAFSQDSTTKALTDAGGGYPGFIKIVEDYGSTNAGDVANLYAAQAYMKEGKFEAALDYLSDYSGGGKLGTALRNGMKGDAFSELGNMDKALSAYKKASKSDNEFFAPYFLLKYGMLSEKQGNASDALAAYKQIKKDYPTSVQGQNVDAYIARVEK
ncbi:MAG: tetratricopeptide repeat protein [Saprospiraceae bacterium]